MASGRNSPLADGAAHEHPSDLKRTLAFATVLVAFVLEVADSTIVNTALPEIRQALNAGESSMQWIVAAYFLSLGTLLLIGGRLGDIYGYRRVFLIGIVTFVMASVMCGVASTAEQLIAARLFQGAAGAIMTPQVMAIVQILYSPLERVSRLAWFGVVGGLSAILGPILGGLLIEANPFDLGWRAIFLINLPVGMIAFVTGLIFIPPLHSAQKPRIDSWGALLFALALGALLGGMIQGPDRGWPWWCWALLVASVALFLMGWQHAVRRVARIGSAVIEPSLFAIPTFFWGLAAVTVFSAASVGFLLVFAVALQQGLGLSPLDTAIQHVPFGLGVMAGISLIGRRYLPRFGRWLLVVGAVIMASAMAGTLALVLNQMAGGPGFIALLFAAGVGMGMVAGPLPPIILSNVDRSHAGTASATLKAVQQVGGALGIALIGGIYLISAAKSPTGFLDALPVAIASVAALLTLAIIAALRLPDGIFEPRATPTA